MSSDIFLQKGQMHGQHLVMSDQEQKVQHDLIHTLSHVALTGSL